MTTAAGKNQGPGNSKKTKTLPTIHHPILINIYCYRECTCVHSINIDLTTFGNVDALILLILTLQHSTDLIRVYNFRNKTACCILIKEP